MTPCNGSKHPATWRERIRAAADAVDTAYAFRAAEFQRAHDAGLSMRQIGEAAELSAAAVHKILGGSSRERVSLDAPSAALPGTEASA